MTRDNDPQARPISQHRAFSILFSRISCTLDVVACLHPNNALRVEFEQNCTPAGLVPSIFRYRRARGDVVTKARSRFNEPIEPMALSNMRENGVRSLAVQCHQCRHEVIMNVDHLPVDLWCARNARLSAPTCGRTGGRGNGMRGRLPSGRPLIGSNLGGAALANPGPHRASDAALRPARKASR